MSEWRESAWDSVTFERVVYPTDEDRQREEMWQDVFKKAPIHTICSAKYARKGDVVIKVISQVDDRGAAPQYTHRQCQTRIFDSIVTGGIFRYIDDSPEGTSERIQANVTLNAYARKIQRWWRRRRDAAVRIQREWRFHCKPQAGCVQTTPSAGISVGTKRFQQAVTMSAFVV